MGLDYGISELILLEISIFEPVSAGFDCLFGKAIDFNLTERVLLYLWVFYLFVNNPSF